MTHSIFSYLLQLKNIPIHNNNFDMVLSSSVKSYSNSQQNIQYVSMFLNYTTLKHLHNEQVL